MSRNNAVRKYLLFQTKNILYDLIILQIGSNIDSCYALNIVYLKLKWIIAEGINITIPNILKIVADDDIYDLNERLKANYIEVSFNNNIDPRRMPEIWDVEDNTLITDGILSYFLAKLSKDISWSVMNKLDRRNMNATMEDC